MRRNRFTLACLLLLCTPLVYGQLPGADSLVQVDTAYVYTQTTAVIPEAPAAGQFIANLNAFSAAQGPSLSAEAPDLRDLAEQVNNVNILHLSAVRHVTPAGVQLEFRYWSPTPNATGVTLTANGTPLALHSEQQRAYIVRPLPDDADRPETVQVPGGKVINLQAQPWVWLQHDSPIAVLTKTVGQGPACAINPFATICQQQYLLIRDSNDNLVVGMRVTTDGLQIYRTLLEDLGSEFTVNGIPLSPDNGPFLIPATEDSWHIDRYKKGDGCRFYTNNIADIASVDLYQPDPRVSESLLGMPANYIMVGSAKIYDAALLRQMLNSTASQLAAISGFSSASITGAFGNLQGVTRDASFLTAQATTTPLPTVGTSLTTGLTGNSQTVTGSATPTLSSSVAMLQCPDGSLPTPGSGNAQGCSAIASTSQPVSGSTSVLLNSGINAPGTTNQQTTSLGTSLQSGTTTNTPGVSGTVPTAPASTALSAPTNIGISSGDILTEQVQLNAQITTLRLLLQGALSDQYVIKHSRAVDMRMQTTLGFTVTLDPPRQFRHAVAEVLVLVTPVVPENPSSAGPESISIVNLLPSEKTYNVAKITSKQNAFGAGAAVAPVSVGVNTGKSKDRMYLAKDSDTLALQYPLPLPGRPVIDRPFPQHAHDTIKGLADFLGPDGLASCGSPQVTVNSTLFGWQFRPVLGGDYVRGGQRQVFAQLALPASVNDQNFSAKVYILTRWRAYDPKKQVVGAAYTSSCSSAPDLSGITLVAKNTVKNVSVADLGGGQIRLKGDGTFYSPSLSVLAGANSISPLTIGGRTIEVFGSAHDLLEAGDLEVLGPNGSTTPFSIRTSHSGSGQCGIAKADLDAIPYPDGNSRMTLRITMGSDYMSDAHYDGSPVPFVLIGSQVYGLKETPFLSGEEPCSRVDGNTVCTYRFVAPTTDIRNAQTFLARDLRWRNMTYQGRIAFYPSFASLTSVASPASSDDGKGPAGAKGKKPKTPAAPAKTTLLVAGFDLDKVQVSPGGGCSSPKPCLTVLVGDQASAPSFAPVSKNQATLTVDSASITGAKLIRFQLSDHEAGSPMDDGNVEWDLQPPKADAPASIVASPTYLRVSDSAPVVFSGDKLSTVDDSTVMFDGATKIAAKLSGDSSKTGSMKLTVYVPTAVTKIAGHKVLTVGIKGSPGAEPIQLPIDVFGER